MPLVPSRFGRDYLGQSPGGHLFLALRLTGLPVDHTEFHVLWLPSPSSHSIERKWLWERELSTYRQRYGAEDTFRKWYIHLTQVPE